MSRYQPPNQELVLNESPEYWEEFICNLDAWNLSFKKQKPGHFWFVPHFELNAMGISGFAIETIKGKMTLKKAPQGTEVNLSFLPNNFRIILVVGFAAVVLASLIRLVVGMLGILSFSKTIVIIALAVILTTTLLLYVSLRLRKYQEQKLLNEIVYHLNRRKLHLNRNSKNHSIG